MDTQQLKLTLAAGRLVLTDSEKQGTGRREGGDDAAVVLELEISSGAASLLLTELAARRSLAAGPAGAAGRAPAGRKRLQGHQHGEQSGSAAPERSKNGAVRIVGELSLDLRKRQVRCGEHMVSLTTLEFDLLAHLVRRAGEVVSREELLRSVWGYNDKTYTNTLNTRISRIRAKLGSRADGSPYIETIRSYGYRFVESCRSEQQVQ